MVRGPWRLLAQVLSGNADVNVAFDRLCGLLRRLGFGERIRGSYPIFTKSGVEEILNLQLKGRNAKTYQVKQVRVMIVKYRLAGGTNGR